MPKSREPNVVRVRIIVPDDFQIGEDHADALPDAADDPNGDQTLESLRGKSRGQGKGGLADLKKKIAAAATKIEPAIVPHDIVAVGHHPFAVIGGTLVGHLDAEHKGGRVTLSLLRQDMLLWEADRPFIVIVRPHQEDAAVHVHGEHGQDHADDRPDPGLRPGRKSPSHPFHRMDHPFVALHSSDREHGRVYRVAAGSVRPDAIIQRHYKATILIGRQRLDPDLIIVPD
jgi:hypothetical protein